LRARTPARQLSETGNQKTCLFCPVRMQLAPKWWSIDFSTLPTCQRMQTFKLKHLPFHYEAPSEFQLSTRCPTSWPSSYRLIIFSFFHTEKDRSLGCTEHMRHHQCTSSKPLPFDV
jgi:hypothetical protein